MPDLNSPTFAITGWSWRTPLGSDIDAACRRMIAGDRAAITNPFSELYPQPLVAPITEKPANSRSGRLVSEIALHAIDVAKEAFAMSGCESNERMGLYAGMGGLRAGWQQLMPAMQGQQKDATDSWQSGLRSMHPLWMLRYLSNNAHGIVAAQLGICGEGLTFSGIQAGAQAYRAATRALRLDVIDRALVLAYDTLLVPELLIAPTCVNSPPEVTKSKPTVTRASSPHSLGFGIDAAHQDMACSPGNAAHQDMAGVPGEAAVAIVLERAPCPSTLTTLSSELDLETIPWIANSIGFLGAAMPLVQHIALAATKQDEVSA